MPACTLALTQPTVKLRANRADLLSLSLTAVELTSIDTPYQAIPTLQLCVVFLSTHIHPIGNISMTNSTIEFAIADLKAEVRINSWYLIGPYEGRLQGTLPLHLRNMA